jgi:hypothetical protein
MPKPKHKKKVHRRQLRNAATMRAPAPRSTRSSSAAIASPGADPKKTTWVPETLQTAGGAAGAAVTCALVARENLMPPAFITGLATAVGGTLAVLGRNETLRNVGAGIMSAAGAQLGLILIDNHYDNLETQKRIATAQLEKVAAEKAKAEQTKATRSADSLPPGALEAAYERARMRLAMAQAASQMVPE